LWTPTFTPLSEQAQPLPTNWGFLLYERKEEFGTERASKVTLGRKTVEIREVSLFLPLHLQLWGGKEGGHIFSETKTLPIGIRYGFEALRALIWEWMGFGSVNEDLQLRAMGCN
jgi:hypothetical protein